MKSLIQFFVLCFMVCAKLHAAVPSNCTQALVGIAEGWDNSQVKLALFEKNEHGQWKPVTPAWQGRLGKSGLVWGLGLHTNPKGATIKREGDLRTPAGIFSIGGLFLSMNQKVTHDKRLPLHRVTARDLWVSDLNTPKLYNRHVQLKKPASTAWEIKEQMKLNDHAHSIKLLIRHNTEETKGRPVLGAGSSIFFHIWRKDGASPSAGCTTMSEQNIRALIGRLRADKNPVYIILPRAEYNKYRQQWRLP